MLDGDEQRRDVHQSGQDRDDCLLLASKLCSFCVVGGGAFVVGELVFVVACCLKGLQFFWCPTRCLTAGRGGPVSRISLWAGFLKTTGNPCPQETGFLRSTGKDKVDRTFEDDWMCSACGVPSFCP